VGFLVFLASERSFDKLYIDLIDVLPFVSRLKISAIPYCYPYALAYSLFHAVKQPEGIMKKVKSPWSGSAEQIAYWEATKDDHDRNKARKEAENKARGPDSIDRFNHIAYQNMIYGKGWNK
jgi:hypothetical protein